MNSVQYTDADGRTYRADSCVPLERAWKAGRVTLRTLARGGYPGKRLQAEEIPGVRSIGYWNATDAQNWGLDWHRNEGIEICFLESGTLDFLIDGGCFALTPGDLTITRPWLSHKLGHPCVGPSKLHWLILDVSVRNPHQEWRWPDWIILNRSDLEDLTRFLRQNEHPVWKTNQDILECFAQMGKTVEQGQRGHYDSKLKIYLNTLFMLLLELFRKDDIELNEGLTDTRRTVELFLRVLRDHLHEGWTLQRMAAHCNLGVTQFSMYCKQITNLSPLKYLLNQRLRYAGTLLREHHDLTITDIGYRVGFSSPQYFATSFKRYYRQTPQAHRMQLGARPQQAEDQ